MRLLLTFTLLLSSLAVTYVHASEMTSKPNILLIMVDDMNEDTVDAVIGGKEVTPRINALKQEGISFERAHVNVAVCQPSRQILMTGKHPHQIGALGFTPIDESVTTLGEVLSENGYFNGIFCKEHHLAPEHKYAWDVVGGTDAMHQGRSIEEFYNRTREFIEMAQSKKQPFFLMANSEDPHRPLYGTVAEKRRFGKILHNFSEPSAIFTAADVDTLMPWVDHLPFNANARRKCEEDLAAYYSSCRRADDSVRRILDALDEMGEADNTIVIFMSDNGMAFPGAKWQTYQAATHTPFIVRWPKGGIVSGTVNSEDFISNIDFMPTILEAVGLKNQTPTDLAGKSFYPLLKGGTSPERDSLVTAHYSATAPRPLTEDSIKRGFSMPKEGAPVNETHIRCYQDAQFAYIYNHWSDQLKTYILGGDGGMGNFIKNTSAEGVKAYRDFMFYRVPEEFYDLRNDPHSLNNLIDDPAYQDTIESYRDKLLAWMVEEMDPKRGDFETFRSDLASPPVEPQRGSAKNHVINGDFESGGAGQGVVPEPWLMSGETDHVKLIWTEEVSGNQVLKLHKERVGRDNFDPAYQIKMYDNRTDDFAAKVFQVISGLPDGNYSLKARVRKEGAFFERAHLCAFTEGGMEHSVVIPTSLSMQTVFVRDIPVRGGQCTIGIDTEVFAGMWTQPAVFLDDIEFFRQPGGETPVMTNEANGAFVMPNARAGSLFYQSIHWILGGAGKEEFTYEKVTGPDWLKLSRDGILKGTPFSRDIGRAVVVVRKSEMQGRSSNVTFTFDVTAAVPDYDLSRGQSLIDLAQPNGPARLRASGMLWGLSATKPRDEILDPLKLQVFRGRLTPWIAGSGIAAMQRMQAKGARIQVVLSDEYNLDPRSRGRLSIKGEQLYKNPNDQDEVAGFGYRHIEIWPGDILPEAEVSQLLPERLPGKYRLMVDGVPHIDMTFIWDDVVDKSLRRVAAAGLDVEWDIWEEPGNAEWFAPNNTENDRDRSKRDANWQRYYEIHVHTYKRIKAADSDAIIVGPSAYRYDWSKGPFIKNFLLYCQEHDALPHSLAWHELMDDYNANPSDVIAHAADMRAFLLANGISIHAFDINEIVSDGRDHNSAKYLWYIAALEQAFVTSACRAVWREDDPQMTFNGWRPMLGGLLTREMEPRSNYWIHKKYASITGTLFNVEEDSKVLAGIAGTDANEQKLTVLLSRINYKDALAERHSLFVRTRDSVIPWLRAGQRVTVSASLIDDSGLNASPGPVPFELKQSRYTVSGDGFEIELGGDAEGFFRYDSLVLVIEPL